MTAPVSPADEDRLCGRSIVLFGGDLSAGGGANRIVRDLSTIFSERLGMETTVICGNEREPTYPFSPMVRIEDHSRTLSEGGYWRLLRKVSRRKPDYLIGFWHWDNIRIALNGLSGQRAIVAEHTSWHHPPLRTKLARALTYRFAKAVCVLNPVELEHYQRFLGNVVLLANPVPALPLSAPPSKEKLILAVGHLIDRKNFRDAILAMAGSGLAAEGWRLVIVGEGPEREVLNDLIRDTGLQSAVEIVAPTSDIGDWYARASVILVTSTIEVFSLVLAEAMSMEVVPLAYAADGPAYILQDHRDLLVRPGDYKELGVKLGALCRAEGLPQRGGAMCRVIRDRFSETAIANKWRSLLLQHID